MENIPHSRQPNMMSKKSCNGSATSTKSIYDDVFGGPPKFGAPTLSPRVEDYSEIFGGFHSSRASSIPVLDLPLVDNEAAEVFFDVRSSGFDYSEVFGGFDGHDFAVPYEELVTMEQSNGHDDSSDEAWTPAEAENLSEESDHSAKDQCLSSGDSCESIDGCMEFNISYNKASKKCEEDLPNGMRHKTQLHDVSGYTFVVDKSSSLPVTDNECCYMQSRDDDYLNMDYSGELFSGRHLRKVMSHPANGSTDEMLFGYDVAPRKDFVRNGSLPKEMFFTITDVSLRTRPSHLPPPSRPPPALDGKKGSSDIATPNCKSVASEESAGDSSPPYFDVEVDAGSSASASAAAMKEAMEKAQAKLKNAKESMERKREGFQSCLKSGSSNDRRNKKEKVTMIDSCSGSKKDERRQGTIQRRDENGMEYSILEEPISDSLEGKNHLNVVKISSEENHGRESLSSQGSGRIDVAGEWKEATQFFELVTNKSKKAIDQANNENFLVHDSNFYECGEKEKMVTVLGLQRHQDNGKKVEKARADHKLEEYGKKSEVSIRAFKQDESFERLEAANKQKRFDKKAQITQEAPREERNEKKFSREWQPVESEKRQTRAYDLQKNLDSVEVQHKESRQTMKHMEKGLQWKEDNKSAGNVKKFTPEKEGSGMRQIKAFELEENEKFYAAFEPAENEIRLKRAAQQGEKEKMIKAVYEWEENQKMQREDYDREENEKRLREAAQQEESERRLKKALEKEENKRRLKENHDKEEGLRIQREAAEWEEKEKRQNDTREREENEKRQREVLEREANEKRLKEAQKEENERSYKETLEKEEWQRRQREAVEQEENAKREREQQNEKRLKEALEKEERQRREREAVEQEENAKRAKAENEKRLKEALENEERQRRQREAVEQKENAKREREANEKRLKEALEKEENERQKEALEQRNNEKKQREAQQRKNYEMESSEIRFKEAFEKEEIADRIKDAHECEVRMRLEEVCEKPENSTTYRYFEEVKEFEQGLKEDHEPEETGDMSQAKCKWEETEMKHMDANDSENQTGLNKTEEDYVELDQACTLNNNEIHGTTQFAGNHENSRKLEAAKEIACEETSEMLSEPGIGEMEATSGILHGDLEHDKRRFQVEDVTVIEQKANEKIKSSFLVDLDIGSQGMRFAYERNERGKNVEQTHVFSNQEDNKVNFISAGAVKEPIETGIRKKGAQPTMLEVKGNTQRTSQQVNASQSAERRVKNSFETLPPEEKESEGMKRERDLERERLRKMEEEWEREREREKDRMAVDRATLETRERAYAEARERAERAAVERATAEARQRALNEARERLEKACAEARDKSFNDKATIEVRIRAERAAVERATVEARERAFEKAMAERAAFEARERVERSVSDKFSASSRNNGIRPSSLSSELQDMQSQGAGTFSGSRYQYSSVYSERSEGVEGESPQRCKARLERHRRTAERAAKALAEKNMRDLLAQREQAERNRLAETLDADVKRWSSGKEGNLRALLSTLQYILGHDSGWQPIPLTEVITAAAVKRAYRKATLCVHPDKLQQRGASIQQKYICEKVFDLLKEAWNKFNSEER